MLLGKAFDFKKIQCTGSPTNNPSPIPIAVPTKKNMKKIEEENEEAVVVLKLLVRTNR